MAARRRGRLLRGRDAARRGGAVRSVGAGAVSAAWAGPGLRRPAAREITEHGAWGGAVVSTGAACWLPGRPCYKAARAAAVRAGANGS